MSQIGKSISDAFTFVSRVGEQCDALAELIKQELSLAFSQAPLHELWEPKEWSQSTKTHSGSWIYTDFAWSLRLSKRSDPANEAHLGVQVSLLCNDDEHGLSPEPLLHMNFWHEPTHFAKDDWMGFPMYGLDDETKDGLAGGRQRLFRWTDEETYWTYSLRLTSLADRDSVLRSIITPVQLLLSRLDDGEAHLEKIQGIVRYTARENMPDYYRALIDY